MLRLSFELTQMDMIRKSTWEASKLKVNLYSLKKKLDNWKDDSKTPENVWTYFYEKWKGGKVALEWDEVIWSAVEGRSWRIPRKTNESIQNDLLLWKKRKNPVPIITGCTDSQKGYVQY